MKLEELALDPELLWLVTFGPGYGESILIRVPGDEGPAWIAVDSLRRQSSSDDFIPALALLDAQPARLAAVVLTHPHRDHVCGMAQLLDQRLPGAPVGCLPAYLDADWQPRDDAGQVLAKGASAAVLNRIDEIWRTESESRWELIAGEERQIGAAKMEVLHPASVPKNRPHDLNKISSPILLQWQDSRILLGADLPNGGWQTVKRTHAAPETLATAHALKVPHHGSGKAQHSVVIGAPPPVDRFCVVTPFNRGTQLPDYRSGEGIDQLLAAHDEVAVTNVPVAARGAVTARESLDPSRNGFGELTLRYEHAPASPRDGWVAVALDAAGTVAERGDGDACGVVVAS